MYQAFAFAPAPVLNSACASASSLFVRPLTLHRQPRPIPARHESLPVRMCAKPRDPMSSSSNSSTPPPSHSLTNLHELTERIADLLQVGSIHKNHLHSPKDAPLGYLSATNHVAVIFGKHLVRDQITVEHAKRILTLIKQIASGSLNPDIICFTGGKGPNSSGTISEAVAGYSFFRSICEEVNLDVSRFDVILEQNSQNSRASLRNVIEELRRRGGPDALTSCHFTLLSSDYHLIRVQEVHRLSPRQSVLFPLEVSSATWNCIFSAYPFCVSDDPPTAFLGRAVVLANDLGIILVNLKGAIEDREFISKENLHRLSETFAKIREMYRVIDSRSPAAGGFRTDMRSHAETLELAIHNVREVHTLLSPLQEVGSSVSRSNLEVAHQLLKGTIADMRSSMDPDRALRLHDRISIVDDMLHFMQEQAAIKAAAAQSDPLSLRRAAPAQTHNVPYHLARSEFDTFPNASQARRRRDHATEVTWQGRVSFEGNGKKISRDGPNLVITDSSAPHVVQSSRTSSKSSSPSSSSTEASASPSPAAAAAAATPTRRTRTHRRPTGEAEALSGSLGGSLASSQPVPQPTTRAASSSSSRRRSSSTTRKPRQSSTSSSSTAASTPKKRKSPTRKLTAPSSGDTA